MLFTASVFSCYLFISFEDLKLYDINATYAVQYGSPVVQYGSHELQVVFPAGRWVQEVAAVRIGLKIDTANCCGVKRDPLLLSPSEESELKLRLQIFWPRTHASWPAGR